MKTVIYQWRGISVNSVSNVDIFLDCTECCSNCNCNSKYNSTFIAPNLHLLTDSKVLNARKRIS